MRLVRVVVILALAATAVVGSATVASAHADLLSSDPASGATLERSPSAIHLTFSEAPDPSLSEVALLNAGGATVPTGTPTMDGARTFVVSVPDTLPRGVYTVTWRVVSADDGHVTSGAFPFGVGTSPTGSATSGSTSESGPTPLSVASKSLLYAGSMLLVAVAVVGVALFGGAPSARRRLGLWAGVAAVAGALGFLVAQQRAIDVPMGTYLRSEAGRDPLWIAIVSLVALVLAIVAVRSDRRFLPWGAAAAAAIVLGLRAHGGHAASAPAPVIAELTQWIHMLAGACWAGGLVLLLLLLRERRDPPVAEARRYSAMAIVAIAVVVASGLVRAFTELGGWSGLSSTLSTGYGQTLAVKIAVVIAVIALGAWNRYRGIGRLDNDARPLRRVVTAEIVGVAGILALTATLTGLAPPASSAEASGDAQAVTVQGSDFATTVTAEMTITPGLPGQNAFRATVSAYGTDQPYAADAVVLQLRSVTKPDLPPASVDLTAEGEAWVAQALSPSVAGTYAASLEVRSGTQVAEVPLVVTTRSTGTVTTVPGPGGETIASGSFPDGVRVDASTSPGSLTPLHLTAFAPNGAELPIRSASVTATPDGGPPQRLQMQRFSTGHFAANGTLAAGAWTFDAVMIGKNGTPYQVTWRASAG